MELRIAERKQAKIKLGLQGPSGSGKTFSALLLAFGLCQDWSKVAIIDTENHSADLYAHLGQYNVLNLTAPFSAERYCSAICACEQAGMQVIIIDSISQEWDDIIERHSKMAGNSFTNWNVMSPIHSTFVTKILQSPCHIICTIRSKQDYVLVEKNNRMVPEKVGMKGITRDGFEYDLSLVFDLDIKHQAKASKDRTGLFMDGLPFVIKPETGKKILDWCFLGKSLDVAKKELKDAKDVASLREVLKKYPEFRKELEPLALLEKNAIEYLEVMHASSDLKS